MNLKGSKTEQNLRDAFAGESQARNKYTYFASKAKKEGYVQIASIFEETANNEKEHAPCWPMPRPQASLSSWAARATAPPLSSALPTFARP